MKPAGDTALSIGTKWPVVLHALSTCRPRTSEAKLRQCVEISGLHRRNCVANAPCYRPTRRSSGCWSLGLGHARSVRACFASDQRERTKYGRVPCLAAALPRQTFFASEMLLLVLLSVLPNSSGWILK
jgi:hypothetical protein